MANGDGLRAAPSHPFGTEFPQYLSLGAVEELPPQTTHDSALKVSHQFYVHTFFHRSHGDTTRQKAEAYAGV